MENPPVILSTTNTIKLKITKPKITGELNEICNFLSKVVVDILEQSELEVLRRGYIIEAFNSRGVHWHSESDDKDIYNFYFEKFLCLSEKGYYYTSDVYRRIANEFSYSSQLDNI